MQKGKEPDPKFKPEPNCKPILSPDYYFNPSSDHYLNSNPNRYRNVTNDPDNCLNPNPDFNTIPSPNHGYIDGSAGVLVWVRRRNGSWWPGRILGPEELPGSHLLSPRTGTPVKLLGREDGSVDWYNIEKSRRVKAFRCGEFDQCIQKALSLTSALFKKREKYARREDAILHALELEKKHANVNQMLGISAYMDKDYMHMSDFGDHNIPLDEDINVMIPRGNFMDPEIPSDSGQASLDSIFDSQGNQSFLHPEWDDDVESIPHVRGIQEVGLKIAASKEAKSTWSDAHGGFPYAFGAEDGNKVSRVMGGVPMSSLVDSKNSSPVSKRKVYTDMNIIEDEDCFKKRRCMTHELQSGLKLDDCTIDLDREVPSSDFDVNATRNGNILKPSVFADKQSSSFPDNVSYDGRPYLYPCSQHEVKYSGITFVDSHLQGNSTSRASLFCGTGYSGSVGADDSDTGKAKSFMMNEYTSLPLSNFNVCSNYSHREEPYEKPANVSCSRGQITGKKMDPTYEHSLETSIPDDVLSTYSFYNDRLDENSIFLKRSSYDDEDSLMLYRTDMGNEMMKPSMQVFKQCLSVVAEEEEEEEERYLRGEDEADSLQPISGPSLSSPEGWDMHDSSSGLSKEKCAADSSSSFYDPYDVEEQNEVRGADNSPSTRDDDIADPFCKMSSCSFGNIMNPLTGCKSIDGNTLPKWQTKGMRRDRTRCIGWWGSISIGSQTGSLFYGISESEEMALGKSMYVRKSKYSLEVNSRSDGKEDILSTMPCSSDLAHKKDDCNVHAGFRYQCRNSTWIDVQVKVKDIVRQNVVLVSIKSKLNGKAISGHSIQVEVIQKQYGDGLCSNKYSLHPAWRTGRRTTMHRIPRCVLSQDYIPGAGDNLKEIMKKPRSHVCSFMRRRKKPSKKHAFAPKRTRMLSSISIPKTNIEPKITSPPVVTCVPVSVIFNRIREVLYKGSNHVVSDSDNK